METIDRPVKSRSFSGFQSQKRQAVVELSRPRPIFQSMFSNKAFAEAAGIPKLIEWFNTIAVYAGLPTNLRLNADMPAGAGPQAMPNPEELQQMMAQIAQQITSQELEKLGGAIQQKLMEPLRDEISGAVEALARRISKLEGASAAVENVIGGT